MSTTRFIVVRHCEAQGNIRRVFNGITDGDITEMVPASWICWLRVWQGSALM